MIFQIHKSLQHPTFWINHLTKDFQFENLQPIEIAFFQQKVLEIWIYKMCTFIFNSNISFENPLELLSINFLMNEIEIAKFLRNYFDSQIFEPTIIIVALLLFNLIWDKGKKSIRDFKILISICIVISMKFNEDFCYSNESIFRELNLEKESISLKGFNVLEVEVLKFLNFDVFISLKDLTRFIDFYSHFLTSSMVHDIHLKMKSIKF